MEDIEILQNILAIAGTILTTTIVPIIVYYRKKKLECLIKMIDQDLNTSLPIGVHTK